MRRYCIALLWLMSACVASRAQLVGTDAYATSDGSDYPVNFDLNTVIQRQDRNFDGVEMNGTTLDLNSGLSAGDKKLFHKDMAKTFFGRPGELTTVVFKFTGTWMNGSVYIDKGQDGSFSWELDDAGKPSSESDLVAFSHLNGKNSNGETVAGNTLNPPSFNMPTLPNGFYRIRFKIDWDCADAGGNTSEANSIVKNGGGIADARLRIYNGDAVSVNVTETDYGKLCSPDGDDLPLQTAYRQPLEVKAVADKGFRLERLELTHGNLEGEGVIHSVPQRLTKTFRLDDFNEGIITIPAELIDGDVLIQGTFVPDDGYIPATSPTLRAEETEGGEILFFDGSTLAERVEVEAGCPETILVYPDAGRKLTGIKIYSDDDEINVTPAQMSLNKYDIPAAMFHDKTQVVCSATFEPLDEGETGWKKIWKYTWGDEFETLDTDEIQRPDNDKWETPTRYSSAWNRFIADDYSVSYLDDGKYVARCIANPNAGGTEMISGAIQSHDKYSFMYGRVEARIKTTPHYGNFPAFWLMPQNQPDGWPNNGEIDIMEQIDAQNVAFQTIHSNWSYNLGKKYDPQSSSNCSVNMSMWHDYALEWDSSQLRWFVDGKRVFSYAKKSSDADALAKGQWPFDREFYVILNQSVGNGSWASNPDKNFAYTTLFDYVRVYQLFDRDDTTGILTVENNTTEDKAWYDLQGRRIPEPTHPGVYIHGRKKIYIR